MLKYFKGKKKILPPHSASILLWNLLFFQPSLRAWPLCPPSSVLSFFYFYFFPPDVITVVAWFLCICVRAHLCSILVSLVSASGFPYLSLPNLRDISWFSNYTQIEESYSTSLLWKVMWVSADQNKVAVGQRISDITSFGLWHVENEVIFKALFRQHI